MKISAIALTLFVFSANGFSLELSGSDTLPITEIHSDGIHLKVRGEYVVKWKFWTLYNEPVRDAVAAIRFDPGSASIEVGYQNWVRLPDSVLAKLVFRSGTVGVAKLFMSTSHYGNILLFDVGVNSAPCIAGTLTKSCWGFNTPGSPPWEKVALVNPYSELFRFNTSYGSQILGSDTAFPSNLQYCNRKEIVAFLKTANLQQQLGVIGVKVQVDAGPIRAFVSGLEAASQDSLIKKADGDLRKSDSIEAERIRRAAKTDTNFWNQPAKQGTPPSLSALRQAKLQELKKARALRDQLRGDSISATNRWRSSVESQGLQLAELKRAAARGIQVRTRHPLLCMDAKKLVRQGVTLPPGSLPSDASFLVDSVSNSVVGNEALYSCHDGTNFAMINRFSSSSNPDRKPQDNWAILEYTGRTALSADQYESARLLDDQHAMAQNPNEVTIWNLREDRRLIGPISYSGYDPYKLTHGDAQIVDRGEQGKAFKVLVTANATSLHKSCPEWSIVRKYKLFSFEGKDLGGAEDTRNYGEICFTSKPIQ